MRRRDRASRAVRRLVVLGAALIACGEADGRVGRAELQRIKLPEGFSIELLSDQVPGARSLALGARGTLFVGTRDAGKLYALPDRNRDGKPDAVLLLASGLDQPNGVAFKDGALYVAEVSRLLRFDGIEDKLESPGKPVPITPGIPAERAHGWKFIRFGPDGRLYLPVGAPCNTCLRSDPRFAAILRMRPDGRELEVFASGIRNTVGFDWHPRTQELWFTDNGRDALGDELPPDELNRAPSKGLHFGYPFCHGGDLADPSYGRQRPCRDFTPPVQKLGPHVAALGMRFYTGSAFPERYRNQIFIAEHGSWNRSKKIGYRLTLVRLDGNRSRGYEVFAEGWLQGEQPWGRPVDLLVHPDGSLLVSDDFAGAIYRIRYRARR